MREAERFLRETLKNALNGPAFFEGGHTSLEWVAPIDRVGGIVGLQHLRLVQQGRQLLLSFAPVAESDRPPAWNTMTAPFPLITNLDKIRFFYQPSAGAGWTEQIEAENPGQESRLPRAIALEIVAEGRSWPPVIVRFDQHRPAL